MNNSDRQLQMGESSEMMKGPEELIVSMIVSDPELQQEVLAYIRAK